MVTRDRSGPGESADAAAGDFLWSVVRGSEELSRSFRSDSTALYRVPLPAEGPVDIAIDGSIIRLTLGSEGRPLGFLYLLDSQPLAMLPKPVLVGVSDAPGREVQSVILGTGHVFVNGRAVWRSRNGNAVVPHAIVDNRRGGWSRPPSARPFPPDDRPVPPSNPMPMPAPPAAPDPGCVPTLLFYGLCFQNPLVAYEGAIGTIGWADLLWKDVLEIAGAFKTMGYETATGLAGDHGDTPAPT